jgi:bifunctional DNA-binding transcriptional regulator/antitoxin component of YhaV-PrlF toxin-antitoxin module
VGIKRRPPIRLTKIVRPSRGGQITIPAEFRAELNIDDRTLLQITLAGQDLRIQPVRVIGATAGSAWARELYGLFAPVRKETARHGEKEIDADVDRAVAAVRRKRGSRRS